MKYSAQLKHPKWHAFRKDVYKRAKFRCQICGKQNTVLEAHHSYYEPSKMAWEYPPESVIALCNSCHSNKVHEKPSKEMLNAEEALLNAEFEKLYLDEQLKFSEAFYKQFIAYIVATRHNGRIEISDKVFSPLDDEFTYQYSYDEERQMMIISASQRAPIIISSRYGRDSEIKEMEAFTGAVYAQGLARYVTELFYDTKSCCCSIKLTSDVEPHSHVASALLEIARETIGQFEWFDSVEHGSPLFANVDQQEGDI